MDRPDTELALDGADQRGALEQRTGERLEGARELRLAAGDLVVETDDAEVLLTGTLLRLDEAGGAVDTGRSQYGHQARRGTDTYQTIRQPVTLGSNYCTVSIHHKISSPSREPYSSGVTRLVGPAKTVSPARSTPCASLLTSECA